jgi:chromosome segregation ATPase
MLTVVSAPQNIALLGSGERDGVGLALPQDHDFIQLVEHLLSRHTGDQKSCKVTVEEALWLALILQEEHAGGQLSRLGKPLILSPRAQVTSFSPPHPNLHQRIAVEQDEEITNLRLQLDVALEGWRESELQTSQAQRELDQVRSELTELQASSGEFRRQSEQILSRLSAERFDLECSLQQLQERLRGDKTIEQMQITTLQRSLTEAREAHERVQVAHKQAQAAHQERERELQAELDEANSNAERTIVSLNGEIEELRQSQAELEQALDKSQVLFAQAQAGHQRRESELQAALDEAISNAEGTAESLKSEIGQLRATQSLLRQSLEEKQVLLDQTQSEHQQREMELQAALDEANRSAIEKLARSEVEFDRQLQSLVERGQSLEEELAAKEQASKDADLEAQSTIASLRDQLKSAQHDISELEQTRQQLVEALQQAQLESQARQDRMNQALEAEKLHASEEQSRFNGLIAGLNEKLEESHAKVNRLKSKLTGQKTLLERKHRIAKRLQHLLKTSEKNTVIIKQRLAKAEQAQQEQHDEFQQLIEDHQLAWKKSSESDIAMQMAKLELASLKSELEQDNANLRAQLEQLEESGALLRSSHAMEIERLQHSLAEHQAAQNRAYTSIRTLKSEQQLLRETKSALERQLAQLKKDSNAQQLALAATIKSGREEIALIRQKLVATNTHKTDSVELEKQRQALQQAEDEKVSLQLKLDELRQVQLELEKQLSKDKRTNMRRSHSGTVSDVKPSRARRSHESAVSLRRRPSSKTITNRFCRSRLGIQCKTPPKDPKKRGLMNES